MDAGGSIEEEPETNLVLAEKLRLDFGMELPVFEGGSIEDYMTMVAESSPSTLDFKVRRQIVFGVFPSARMAMYHDLDTATKSFDQSNVLGSMFVGSESSEASPFAKEYEIDSPEVEKKIPNLVLDADSSQYSTLVDVADEKNVSVEGPPGTGKSQTIVNAIAAALGSGKKVLFVAEKMAALDVVRSRLEAVDLGEFVLPLQAERSTREKVIKSIRDRVEMEEVLKPREYETKIESFKEHRAELTEYVDVISQPFGEAGLTVHDILWKSISTQHTLAALPIEIQRIDIENVELFSYSEFTKISDRSKRVENAWFKAEDAGSFWKRHIIQNIDKFTVDDICETASSAAIAYGKAGDLLQKLSVFGIDPNEDIDPLEVLSGAVHELKDTQSSADTGLIDALSDPDNSRKLKNFLSQCQAYREVQDEFSLKINDPANPEWESRFVRIQEICTASGFETLNIEKLRNEEKSRDERLAELQNLASKLGSFIEAFPECTDFSVDKLHRARVLVDEFPRHSLAIRNEITAEPNSAILIRQAQHLGEKLRTEKAKLEVTISLNNGIASEALRRYAAEISQSSFFSILSSRFRATKKAYSALSLRASFIRESAVSDLNGLAGWQDDYQKFVSLPELNTIFGGHFRDIDTDFNLFSSLLSFYEAVDQNFPGIENLSFRQLLKTGDIELLDSIPVIEADVWTSTLSELESEITEMINRRESVEGNLQELSSKTHEFQAPERFTIGEVNELRLGAQALRSTKDEIENASDIRALLGDRFAGTQSDAEAFNQELSAAEIIMPVKPHWGRILLELLSADRIVECQIPIRQATEAIHSASSILEQVCQLTGLPPNHFVEGKTSHEVSDMFESAAADKDGLYAHSEFSTACAEFVECGLPDLNTILEEHDIALSELGNITGALISRCLAKLVYQKFGSILSKYRGEKLNDLREKLAKTDRTIIKLSRRYLKSKICRSAVPPSGRRMGKKSTWTEWALIKNEINKKKRFVPVRDLTQRAGEALLELKPCWMMSPLAVAQYLPRGTVTFDLCIIDEASQMPPEDAVGALVRCNQALVVGDTNQLPPTTFFRRMIDDEEADEDETVLDESVLEMANAAFHPKRRLRWHYRSRHSGLIKFSNRHIYDDDLIVFPSANENRKDMGVSLVSVEGHYKSGVNGPEAAAIIDAALNFMYHNPDRSLGIVTLNQKQRDLLIEEMEYALRNDSISSRYIDTWKERNDGLESFFIKNLENIQGDERDVIFIGTVYGAEKPGGPVMQRFGPINGLAGRRRLNVLFSRAKEQIVTFSSMTSADIRADEHGNPGTYLLKQWLEYSATGVLDAGEITQKEPDSDFEIFVIDQIKAMGCVPVPQVGVAGYFIDIGIKHPSWPHGFILGVECDGATYHSSKSARDRDRLRQEVMEGLGWHFHRIWSTDWFNDPQKEAERLRDVITKRLEQLKTKAEDFVASTIPAVVPAATEEVVQGDVEDTLDDVTEDNALDDVYTYPDGVSVGDTVHVRYLTGSGRQIELTLSDKINDPSNGVINILEPMGEALLGAEEGEEIEVLVGSYVRRAVIEKLEKAEALVPKTPQFSSDVEISEKQPRPTENETGLFERDASKPAPQSAPQQFDKKLSPDRFYDTDYQFVIRDLSFEIIDNLGPITFRHLCEKIARFHGFQRTGSQIRKTVWAAIHKDRKPEKGPKGENIFWPKDKQPANLIPFRGMKVSGEERSWKQVPYPEKLGLAHLVVTNRGRQNPVEAMAQKIGLRQLRQKTREELEELLNSAAEITRSEN